MDSTNSGSNQSSSSGGGDNEEYDDDDVASRADLSSFLNLLPSPPPPPVNTSSSSSIYDSFSPYFAPFPFPPPPEAARLSLDASAAWSSLPPPTPPPPPPPPPPPQPPFSASAPAATAPISQAPPRGSKKRTRASRRAPTTVINTEASNFRAMVQQFTGFPTPPFAAAPFPTRPRLDLFGPAAAGVVPPFLLRPSAHSMIPSPLSSSSVASLFGRTISRPSHLATAGASATADSSDAIPPKYHDHDKFNLSLFGDDTQSGAAAAFDAPLSFLQPPRSQMAALPQFPTDSGAMNPGWDVEDEQAAAAEERNAAEPAPSQILIRNFQNDQS